MLIAVVKAESSGSVRGEGKDMFARVVALATLALTCFNTYSTFHDKASDDTRHVSTLVQAAWDDLAGAEGAPAIASNLALTASQRRDLEKVGRKIDEALSYDPKNPMALTLKGIYFAKCRKSNEARAKFQEALTFEPTFAPAKSALGRLLADEGKCQEAIVEFQSATSLDPSLPSPYLGWAFCLRQLHKDDEAAAILQKGIEAEPAFAPLYLDLGNIYAAQDRRDAALDQYRKCRDVDDSLPGCYKSAVVVMLRSNRFEEARELVNKAQEKGIMINMEKKPAPKAERTQGS